MIIAHELLYRNAMVIMIIRTQGKSFSERPARSERRPNFIPALHFLKWSIITKQPYTWTNSVKSNVCVGLLTTCTWCTTLWKCKAGLKLGGRSLEVSPYRSISMYKLCIICFWSGVFNEFLNWSTIRWIFITIPNKFHYKCDKCIFCFFF